MLAQTTTTTSVDAGVSTIGLIVYLVIWVVILGLPLYFVFKKAGSNGDPAWSAFIPIYQWWTLIKVVGRPSAWFWLLALAVLWPIPFLGWIAGIVALVFWIIVMNDLSKSFGKGGGFTVGLVLLNWIFLAILAWGSAIYRGPAAASGAMGAGSTPPPPPPPAI
jgi:hypothetical protein